jgi:hypothetical protein
MTTNTTWITDENGVKWAADDNGNKCSVRYFGSEERAEKALKSLKDCENCIRAVYSRMAYGE